ncbi:MAG TPA: glycosyltransferase [Candidatus Sulfomarinibacteraceae bacterium]|nr:glycosyltransferase [Candidatus Sulfomarinibacteraceae bacterium]
MRVLLVASRFPLPPWRGNQLRSVQWLEALTEHDRLLLCPPGRPATGSDGVGADTVALPRGLFGGGAGLAAAVLGGRPAQEGVYVSGAARRRLAEEVAAWRPDVAVVQMVRCAWAADEIRRVAPKLPVLFDAVDCMALHYRRAAAATHPLLRPAYRLEAERCRRRETELVRRAALTVAVTRRDLDALGAGDRGRVVPVAAGALTDPARSSGGAPLVLLSGNLGYRPTVRAALWFADRVWPELRVRVPDVRWLLAGARPAPAVRRLASRPGVEVEGDVGDLADRLRRATVAVAPMDSGSGVALKILEAMAAGVPVVADPWSAAGLEEASAVAVADDPEHWVATLAGLLSDSTAARRLGEQGHASWQRHYAPEVVRRQLRDAVEAAAGGAAAPG